MPGLEMIRCSLILDWKVLCRFNLDGFVKILFFTCEYYFLFVEDFSII